MPRTLADEVPAPAAPPTTTTVATVTTTTTPAQAAVPWFKSMKFRAYVGGWFSLVLGWAVENLSSHSWDFHSYTWIAISVTTLLTIKSIIADWMNPNVDAPFGILNKGNV